MAPATSGRTEAPSSPPRAPLATTAGNANDISEKYQTLKRRFHDLEEETSVEIQRSGERNVRMREERDSLLERIVDLEKQQQGIPEPAISRPTVPRYTPPPMQEAEEAASRRRQAGGATVSSNGQAWSARFSNADSDMDVLSTSPSARRSSDNDTSSPSLKRPHSTTSVSLPQPIDGDEASVVQVSAPNVASGSGISQERPPPSSPPPSPKRRRKTKDSEPADASPARQTRSRLKSVQNGTPLKNGGLPANSGVEESSKTDAASSSSHRVVGASEPHQAPSLSINTADAPTSGRVNAASDPNLSAVVKVAEAAAAARTAASSSSSNASKTPSTSHTTPAPDANIDPSLIAQTPSNSKPSSEKSLDRTASPASTSSQPATNGSATTSTVTTPLSGNPYLNLFLPRSNPNGTPTPTSAHPMAFANPYMFYAPITPVTPNTPSYYNPYLYMAPMIPGAYPPHPPTAHNAQTASASTSTRPAPPPSTQPESATPPPPKPKRTKAHAVTSKSFSIPLVPRDKSGRPMLPLNVGIMTVISLGTVCMREHFHTERYIFPVGYEVTRRYLSTVDPTIEVVYHCTILDGGDGPKFQIVPSDTPDKPVIAGTATGAWSSIVKQANAIRNRQHSNSVSGPDFFGLGQNTIKHLIQELPNADKLKNYVWQTFLEGGPLGGRHASVIPALPEEYDASVPRGPVYHTPLEREKLRMVDGAASPGEMPKGLSHYPQHIIAQARLHHHNPAHISHPLQVSPASQPPPPPPPPESAGPSTSVPPSISHSEPSQTTPLCPEPVPPNAAAPSQNVTHPPPPPTFIPNASMMTQAPTPITPNTPAPSIASIMNAYRSGAS